MDYSKEHIDVAAYIGALKTSAARASVYISAGIHGDEPTGPLAVLKMLEDNCLHASVNWHLLPLLNPTGTARHRRGNAQGKDINRDYKEPSTPEAKAHVAWLRKTSHAYDAAICLHEDWEAGGYYIYELNLDRREKITGAVMSAVEPIAGIDRSPVIEGYPAADGVIQPPANVGMRPDWPETIYLIEHHTRLGYTFETPCNLPLETRIKAHIAGVDAATGKLCGDF